MSDLPPTALYFIQSHEGYSAKGYLDAGGTWTIGYGSTRGIDGRPLPRSLKVVSRRQASVLAQAAIDRAYTFVRAAVKVPVTENQMLALTSLVYNIGEPAFARSNLLGHLNRGHYDRAASEFRRWVYHNGKIQKGLVARRASEATLFRN